MPLQRLTWQSVRDIILFFGGLAGVAHETLIAAEPNALLLAVFGAMLGLPMFLRKDEK